MSDETQVSLTLREKIRRVVFEADTPSGKLFDVVLLWTIVFSIVLVMLESINSVEESYGYWLDVAEWACTIIFTIEYSIRIWVVAKPLRYMTSFYGVIDLLAIIPSYLSLIFAGSESMLVIRVLRFLRIFRLFKLARYVGEGKELWESLKASRPKITVFLATVLSLVIIVGALMYLVEGNEPGTYFTSIPQSIYWAIVTITTVGYGDIVPITIFGKMIASVLMIMGYGIIAVPTGIVTVEMARQRDKRINTRTCPACGEDGHELDAKHCKYCGAEL